MFPSIILGTSIMRDGPQLVTSQWRTSSMMAPQHLMQGLCFVQDQLVILRRQDLGGLCSKGCFFTDQCSNYPISNDVVWLTQVWTSGSGNTNTWYESSRGIFRDIKKSRNSCWSLRIFFWALFVTAYKVTNLRGSLSLVFFIYMVHSYDLYHILYTSCHSLHITGINWTHTWPASNEAS